MSDGKLQTGWAQADITPDEPVYVIGQFHARVSEGVRDAITATALVLDSGAEHVVLVSIDTVAVGEALQEAIAQRLDGPDPGALVMNATHTHTAPPTRGENFTEETPYGVELDTMPVDDYVEFAAERIADAINDAWASRAEGSIAFGLGQAVVGRNRRWVDVDGTSYMYGNTDTPEFSHIEGYEDHSVNVLATYDAEGDLTGVVCNLACPSQETEGMFVLSADFWCEAREEMRRRFADDLFVLPQASAAGDQSPHLIWGEQAHERMLELKGRTSREEIGHRIADAVEEVLEYVEGTADDAPILQHEVLELDLPLRLLSEQDVQEAVEEAEVWREQYEAELQKLEENPELKEEPRWYVPVTKAWRKMRWNLRVRDRWEEQQQEDPVRHVTLHVIRIGDMAIATNPFEYYLDYGLFIKTRSPATQTFVVQLAGPGSYVPSERSIAGGGYGSLPASTPIGSEGGREVAERTVESLLAMWDGGSGDRSHPEADTEDWMQQADGQER